MVIHSSKVIPSSIYIYYFPVGAGRPRLYFCLPKCIKVGFSRLCSYELEDDKRNFHGTFVTTLQDPGRNGAPSRCAVAVWTTLPFEEKGFLVNFQFRNLCASGTRVGSNVKADVTSAGSGEGDRDGVGARCDGVDS